MILYSVPVSLYCAKTRILLRHKGITWDELPPAGGYGAGAYKAIVPSGNLPAIDDDGFILADSEAIAEYLNEKHPTPAMLPGDLQTRARARELGRFHDTRLEPALRLFFPLVGLPDPDQNAIAQHAKGLNARLNQLAQMLTPETGEPLTFGDCGYEPTFMWIERLAQELGFAVNWPSDVVAYRARLQSHDAVKAEIAHYKSALDPWITAKRAERG